MRLILILASITLVTTATAMTTPKPSAALIAAVAAPTRSASNVARDKYRKPAETIAFFGLKPTDTVVEIWPGGGWYTEILAPYLAARGKLIVAPAPGKPSEATGKRLAAAPLVYAKVGQSTFPGLLGGVTVPAGSVDAVVTFRNVHNWRMGDYNKDEIDYSKAAFAELYAMLKPGGVLGIEDHRLPETADVARERTSGYLKVSTVRRLAEAAGFRYVGSSEVNANPRDTKDYPGGVWTLPPSFAEKEVDREKYAAIGESDRMTLKFVKPKR